MARTPDPRSASLIGRARRRTISTMASPATIAAFYHFAPLARPGDLQPRLRALCNQAQLRGTILLAPEGINGTMAGPREGVALLLKTLRGLPGFSELRAKFSEAASPPFHRLRVRVKGEIVTMGDQEIDPRTRVGTYVKPDQWNAVVADPEVVVIDTRNAYETRIGSFEGALDPQLDSFREFPAWAREHLDPGRHRKVAMFCTGGIRCEKASSLLLREGFEEVLHLEGGILAYLEQVPREHSSWRGECFVFDQRVAVDHDLRPGVHELCFGCREPISPAEREDPRYEAGVCCSRCEEETSEDTKLARRERSRQMSLASARGARHLGD